MKLSILVPIYNAEKTIAKCLDSLLAQTSQHFELICIDDGSSDKSIALIENYVDKFKSIRVIKQKNMGIALTRQRLIEYSTGEYIMFCDSDDYLESTAVENILKIVDDNHVDLIIFGYRLVRVYTDKMVNRKTLPVGIHKKEEWEFLHVKGIGDLYWSVLWNKCYKKKVIELPNMIKFQTLLEDVTFNVEYLGRCNNLYVCETVLYNYVQMGESLTRSVHKDTRSAIVDAWAAYDYLWGVLSRAYPNCKKIIYQVIFFQVVRLCDRTRKLKDTDLLREIKHSNQYKELKQGVGLGCVVVAAKRYKWKTKRFLKRILQR